MSANEIRRAADHHLVMEFIHGIQPEAETDEERQAEEAQEENAEAVSGNQAGFTGKANSSNA